MAVDNTSWTELSAIFESVGFNCSSGYCGSPKNCSDLYGKMSYIKIVIDDSAYWIPPQGYTLRKQRISNDACVVAITSSGSHGIITLGTYFLASYYAQFNYTSD